MSSPLLPGLYRPGGTWLHRSPVGRKLLGLAAFSLLVVLVRSTPASFGFLTLAVVLAVSAGVGLRGLMRASRGVLVAAVVVAALQWWVTGPAKAVETLLDLVALALAAVAVSATTPVNAMLDAMTRWIAPLRRVGVDADRVALTVALAVQALPGTIALAAETRDAARARGLERSPRAFLTPFVIRVIARAHETGDALHARGIGDPDQPE